ncbi:predicted protein [Streptomyces sp. SPB78]|nr:predicted protein [Streptomyces sp. SPB78]
MSKPIHNEEPGYPPVPVRVKIAVRAGPRRPSPRAAPCPSVPCPSRAPAV